MMRKSIKSKGLVFDSFLELQMDWIDVDEDGDDHDTYHDDSKSVFLSSFLSIFLSHSHQVSSYR